MSVSSRMRSLCSPESGHLSPWHHDGVFLYDKAILPTLGTRTLERFSFCGQDSINTCQWKRAHSPPLLPSQMLSCLELPTTGSHEGIFWSWSLLSTQSSPASPAANPATPQWVWSFLFRGALLFTQHVAVRGYVPWRYLNSQQRRKVICTELMQGMNGSMRVWTKRIRI